MLLSRIRPKPVSVHQTLWGGVHGLVSRIELQSDFFKRISE